MINLQSTDFIALNYISKEMTGQCFTEYCLFDIERKLDKIAIKFAHI